MKLYSVVLLIFLKRKGGAIQGRVVLVKSKFHRRVELLMTVFIPESPVVLLNILRPGHWVP